MNTTTRTGAVCALLLPLALAGQAVAETAAPPEGKNPRRFVRVRAPDGIVIRRYNKTEGKIPEKEDRVVVHYHGTLKDGTVFDSSVDRGRPASFSLEKVIPCWTEAITRLRVGEKAEIICPPATAYGLKGSPPTIPQNATLTFEVELLSVH
jgi:FKBP-type peptidyl-prolyl cis-trans isomerase FkpA